jgi:ubiquitin C-terminal hydrolase
LNIRQEKPYFVNPESDGRNIEELAVEAWSNFLHRNWSFIIFMFYGQLKSFLKCMDCGKERVLFSEFSTLSLPLPESSVINFKLEMQLLPYELKTILTEKSSFRDKLQD